MSKTSTEFKDTKIGRIPKDWEVKKLGEIISLMTDYVANGSFESLKKNVLVRCTPDYAYYIRLFDIRKGIGHQEQKYLTKKSYDFLSKSKLCGGEILIANIGANVGETFVMPKLNYPASIAPNMIVIHIDENISLTKYVYYFSKSYWGLKELQKIIEGGGQPKINKTKLKTIQIPLPPLQEQEKIASILTTVDDKLDSISAQISETEVLKKGLMQKLFSEGIGHTEFKDTKIGRIPESWEVKKLGEVTVLLKDGTHGSHKNVAIGIPLLSAKDIRNGKIILNNNPRLISENEYNKLHQKYIIQKNDILLTVVGTIGRSAIVKKIDSPFTFQRSVAILRFKQKINPEYIYHFFNCSFFIKNLMLKSNSSAQAGVYLGELGRISVPLPPLPEQEKIASILTTVDDKTDLLKEKKTEIDTLKKGLMQKLLTGEMRVKV